MEKAMKFEISDEDMEYIREEAYRRFYDAPSRGRPEKKLWQHANDAIGEWIVCEAIGIDWGGDISATRIGSLRVKMATEHWRGLTIAVTEPSNAVYALVTPAYTLEPSTSYIFRGWMTGTAMRELEAGQYVKDKKHVRIVNHAKLWDPSILASWVWAPGGTFDEN